MNRKYARIFLAAAILIAVASCRTTAPSAPAQPLPKLTVVAPDSAMTFLQTVLADTGSLSTVARVSLPSGESRRSFKARIVTDKKGAITIDALTPLGTTAFSLYADKETAIVVNPNEKWYWTGTFRELVGRLAIPFKVSPGDFGRAIFGLPPEQPSVPSGASTPGGAIYANQSAFIDVASTGLQSIRWLLDPTSGVAAEVALYDPPAFPPKHVSFSRVDARGGQTPLVDVEHLSIEAGGTADKPEIRKSYRQVTNLDEIFSGLR